MTHWNRSVWGLPLLAALAAPATAGQLSETLADELRPLAADDFARALVVMEEQYPTQEVDARLRAERADLATRHETVVAGLRETAETTQRDLLAWLDAERAKGRVKDVRSLFVANIVFVEGQRSLLEELADRADAGTLYPNYPVELVQPIIAPTKPGEDAGRDSRTLGNGLPAIQADRVWHELGVTGEGALVCNIDTGVDGAHTALTDRWRGNHAPAAECFYDPILGNTYPYDSGQHGTHTMGTITGMSPVTGDTTGVAFGAEWICAATIDHPSGGGIEGTIVYALQSFQWALDPDGNGATLEDMPDVISNSWGIPLAYRPACDETYWAAIDHFEAAGEVVVFAAGNEGFSGLRTPPDRAATAYSTFTVGALDVSDPFNPFVAGFSSRGPTPCSADPELQIKPDISAPGVNIYSSVPGGGYSGSWSGTSMACPHVAGVVALMRSANPGLDVTTIKQIIFDTATDIDATGDDNNTGHGMINAYEAVLMSMSDYGRVEGTVTDASTTLPIAGATVLETTGGRQTSANALGHYFMSLPGDSNFTLLFHAFGYEDLSLPVATVTDDTVTVDAALTPSTPGTLAGVVWDTHGNTVAGATVSVPGTPVTPVLSGPGGVYSIDVPGNASYDFMASAPGLGSVTDPAIFVAAGGTTSHDFFVPDDPIYSPTPPDAYGYRIYDMNDVGGPAYAWDSIADVGTPMALSDDSYGTVTVPFAFDYYGVEYTQLSVASNGYVTPGATGYTTYSNSGIPSTGTPNGSVYVHWDDLNPGAGGQVYTYYDAALHSFIVEWSAVPYYGGGGDVSMQVVVRDAAFYPTQTGDASFVCYFNHLGRTNSCTVGLENSAGTDGIQYAYDGSYHVNASPLGDAFALLITTGFLTAEANIVVEPTSIDYGDVFVGGSVTVDVAVANLGLETLTVSGLEIDHGGFDAPLTGFVLGAGQQHVVPVAFEPTAVALYNANLLIHSDDPDDPVVAVPLAGVGLAAPVLWVDPSSITEHLPVDGTSVRTLTIGNSGGSPLEATLALANIVLPPAAGPGEPVVDAPSTVDESRPEVASERRIENGGERTLDVVIFRDNLAWGYDTNEPALLSLGATVSIAGSADMGTLDLGLYDMVLIESQQSQAFYNTLQSHVAWFESYLASGGTMEIHVSTYTSNRVPTLALPGGASLPASELLDPNNYIADPAHPIVQGLVDPFLGNYASHEYLVLPGNGHTIIENSGGQPTVAEYDFGAGHVLLSAMTWEWAVPNGYSAGDPFVPALAYMLEIASGPDWIALGSQSVTVPAGSSVDVDVLFDATGLAEGTYLADIVVESNDPDAPETVVPATLIVGAGGGCEGDEITVAVVQARPTVVLAIAGGQAGNTYLIYRSTNGYSFAGAPYASVAVVGGAQNWTDPTAPSGRQFYRIVESCVAATAVVPGGGRAATVSAGGDAR